MFCGNELSSSLEDPPKENIAPPFFFGRVGCKLLAIELGCSLNESSPEEPPSANIADFFEAGALEGMLVLDAASVRYGAERSGMDLCDELTCDGENPLTTLVELCSEPPLTAELASEDALADEPELTAEESSCDGISAMSCGVVLRCG